MGEERSGSTETGPTRPAVTVAELLPAMIELASIQLDLLKTLERPRAKAKSFYTVEIDTAKPVAIETSALQTRGRELLRYLLEKAGEEF